MYGVPGGGLESRDDSGKVIEGVEDWENRTVLGSESHTGPNPPETPSELII